MERHIVDHPRSGSSARLPRYVKYERINRVRGPHHAVNVLRRLPRGAGDTKQRMQTYLRLERRASF